MIFVKTEMAKLPLRNISWSKLIGYKCTCFIFSMLPLYLQEFTTSQTVRLLDLTTEFLLLVTESRPLAFGWSRIAGVQLGGKVGT